MNQLKTFKTEIGGREVTVEVGKYAQLSNGSCIIKCGDTVVMTNVTMAAEPRPGMDFFPLGVDFEERCTQWARFPEDLKERGTSKRQGDTYLSSYRQTYSSVVP